MLRIDAATASRDRDKARQQNMTYSYGTRGSLHRHCVMAMAEGRCQHVCANAAAFETPGPLAGLFGRYGGVKSRFGKAVPETENPR